MRTLAGVLWISSWFAVQTRCQTASAYLPFPDPGYDLYFHDTNGAAIPAVRWGYHDGWTDGRRDRNHGVVADPKQKDAFAHPNQHGALNGSTKERYDSLYRNAYLHGYQHGSRL